MAFLLLSQKEHPLMLTSSMVLTLYQKYSSIQIANEDFIKLGTTNASKHISAQP